jgi:glycine C-acetyltransferase
LISQLTDNLQYFKGKMTEAGFSFAADSAHAIQPVLLGDPALTKAFKEQMFEKGFIVTNINYPVVPKGRDEIRVQLSATHTREDIDAFLEAATMVAKNIGAI